jgi:hypothetical protein
MRRYSQIIFAGIDDGHVWLRGRGFTALLRAELLSVADSPLYRVDEARWLFPPASSVPTLQLPDLKWVSLDSLLTLSLPTTQYANVRVPRAELSQVRGGTETQANVLIGSWEAFRSWAEDAPLVRLTACYFAVSKSPNVGGGDARAIVAGKPLPPIVGERFYLLGKVALPVGFTWEPAVDVQTVEQVIRRSAILSDEEWAEVGMLIWNRSGEIEVVMKHQLIMALRQNICATAASLSA